MGTKGDRDNDMKEKNQNGDSLKLEAGFHELENEDDWSTLRTSNESLIILYSAGWCKPCRKLKPLLHDYISKKLVILEVDIDRFDELAMEEEVFALPTLQFYKNGKKVDQITGYHPEETKTYLDIL